ncbi:MAG: hypothetical protein IKH42_05260 [Lachnospiraceae bacterium]|nr:hypothetical protein [Lachnospiraceae bacterium]
MGNMTRVALIRIALTKAILTRVTLTKAVLLRAAMSRTVSFIMGTAIRLPKRPQVSI